MQKLFSHSFLSIDVELFANVYVDTFLLSETLLVGEEEPYSSS
jgi:hypothetical protein